MAWTDVLINRPAPRRSAPITVDLACSSCGYNLFGLDIAGKCPECGTSILESLGAVSDAGEGVSAVDTIARTMLVPFALILAPLGIGRSGVAFAALVVTLTFAAAARAMAAWNLRARTGLDHHPAARGRVTALFTVSLLELAAALVLAGAGYAASSSATIGAEVPAIALGVWSLVFAATVVLVARLGHGVAKQFELPQIRGESITAVAVLAGTAVLAVALSGCGLALTTRLGFFAAPAAWATGLVIAGCLTTAATIRLGMALPHLGDTIDDVI